MFARALVMDNSWNWSFPCSVSMFPCSGREACSYESGCALDIVVSLFAV